MPIKGRPPRDIKENKMDNYIRKDGKRIYRFARWWKVNYFLIEVSITEPQGSSITESVTQSITAQSEQIA